jgi:hypothetical protein
MSFYVSVVAQLTAGTAARFCLYFYSAKLELSFVSADVTNIRNKTTKGF